MSFEGKNKKSEQADSQENKTEKELSLSEIDELLKKSEKVSDNLDKFSKDELFKKVNFYNKVEFKDRLNDEYDSIAYEKAGFWRKYENFTRFGFHKERYGLLKSKERGLLDKSKINKDVSGQDIDDSKFSELEKIAIEEKLVGNIGMRRKDLDRIMVGKRYEIVDGEIVKIIKSHRTESGAVEAAREMREAEISRLETVNGTELVGLKGAMERNTKSKESFLKLGESMSNEEREKVNAKLDEEENQTKEKIKEREEKLSEETKKFREPLEGRLQETLEIENSLMEAFDFIKTGESNLNKQIKDCESFIKEAQKLDLLGGVGGDVVKIFENKKSLLDAQAKEFAERKELVSSKLEMLKNNKKEIEATLNRVNNIGKTEKEIEKEKKSEKKMETKTESTGEEKDDKRKEKTWDETRDEVWGLTNKEEKEAARTNYSPIKSGEGRSYIDKLFEHYDDSGLEETKKSDDKKDEAEKKVETKKSKKSSVKGKPKDTKGTEAAKNTGKSKKTESGMTTQIETQEESGVVETDQVEDIKFTDEEIEKIVMKELKTVGFMNNKKVAEKSKDGLTKHLIGAVKNEILKFPEKVTEKFIKNEVDDWYKRLTKNLNESGK